MDKAVEQANETGRADFIMRTEIEHLKEDMYVEEPRGRSRVFHNTDFTWHF